MSEIPDFDLDGLDLDLDVDDLPPLDELGAAQVAAGFVDPLHMPDLETPDLGTAYSEPGEAEEPKFAGVGCDCAFNPSTCGAGGFCRWQKR